MIDKDLLKLLGKNKKYVVYTVLVMLLGSFANIGITACICWAVYLLMSGSDAIMFLYPALIALACAAVRFISTKATGSLKDKIGREVKKELRHRTYNKILTLGVKGVDNMNMAGLTQVAMEGIEQLDLYYSTYLPQFFFSLIVPVVLFCICVGMNWQVSLLLICLVPVIPMSIVMVSKYAKKIFNKYWDKYTSMGDEFLDSVQGLNELKIYKADGEQHKYINESAEEFRKITMKVLVMQLSSVTIMDLVAFGGAGGGIALAIAGMINETLPTATGVAQCLFMILVAVEFFLPLRSLGSAFHVAMNGASAGRKIITILNMDDPLWGEKEVEGTDISIKDVTFSYDGERDVLKGINASFPSKGMTAVVGESGCGKSTLVSLITGAIRPKEGDVLLGDSSLETYSRNSYYSNLASVSYNTYIFNDSIRNNFYLAKEDISDEEIYEALKKVNLDTFVRDNGGLDKVVQEDSTNISGGQRQRLALAINLVSDKKIYVFDEATSNIDTESEALIMDNVKELAKTKNVIVISHRLANVVDADNIYYMEEGEIKEQGNHKELMDKNGGYSVLFNTQKHLEQGYLNASAQEVRA